jgi:hypothetical protein
MTDNFLTRLRSPHYGLGGFDNDTPTVGQDTACGFLLVVVVIGGGGEVEGRGGKEGVERERRVGGGVERLADGVNGWDNGRWRRRGEGE